MAMLASTKTWLMVSGLVAHFGVAVAQPVTVNAASMPSRSGFFVCVFTIDDPDFLLCDNAMVYYITSTCAKSVFLALYVHLAVCGLFYDGNRSLLGGKRRA